MIAVITAMTDLRFVFVFEDEGMIALIGCDLEDVFERNMSNHDGFPFMANHSLDRGVIDV